MSYIEDNLTSQEQIIKRAEVSKAYVFVRPLIPIVISVFTAVLVTLQIPTLGIMVVALGIFIAVPVLLNGLIMLLTTEIALTNQRIIMKWGLIRRTTVEVFNHKLEGIAVDQSILGRFLGYGSLSVSGTGGSHAGTPGIAEPLNFRKAVNEYIQNQQDV